MISFNIHWPKNPGNNYSPWYTILWRAVWIGPAYLTLIAHVAFVGLAHGWSTAKSAWRDNT